MKKKNTALRIAAIVIVASLFATCMLSGTTALAKYTSTASGAARAQVALWLIEVDGEDIVNNDVDDLTIDLFETLKEEDTTSEEVHVVRDAALDVTDGNGRVAPGTGGSLAALAIENLSEVYAEYTITITGVDAGDIPLEFSLDGGDNWDTAADVIDQEFVLDNGGSGYAPGTTTNAEDMENIVWRWVFDVDDAADLVDTDLGKAGTEEASLDLTITATQVD